MNSFTKPHITFRDMRFSVIPIIDNIRKLLAERYDVTDKYSPNFNYRGLCNEACDMFTEKINIFNKRNKTDFKVIIFHGEQRHIANIDPDSWMEEHTWAGITNGHETIYIDITSQQFQWLYKDIPDYYVSTKPPKWFLPDNKNLYIYWYGRSKIISNIIGIIQYIIWASICRTIRKIKKQ